MNSERFWFIRDPDINRVAGSEWNGGRVEEKVYTVGQQDGTNHKVVEVAPVINAH